MNLQNKNVLLGVTSGVAIYKACSLVGRLKHSGADVKVVMTENATKLITAQYFAELSGNPVAARMFDETIKHEVEHIALANWADIAVIAPATANIIGKVVGGIADDMLSTTIMAVPIDKKPVIFVPAMNTAMWENPIVQLNIDNLKRFGYEIVEPVAGYLACGTVGVGKMADSKAIVEAMLRRLFD